MRLVKHGNKELGGLQITHEQYKQLWEMQPVEQRPKKKDSCTIAGSTSFEVQGDVLYNAAHLPDCCVTSEGSWDAVSGVCAKCSVFKVWSVECTHQCACLTHLERALFSIRGLADSSKIGRAHV